MPCSAKKRLSNRENALKSTGPNSPGGKAKVGAERRQARTPAEHLILPGEDPAAFDAMLAAWRGDWRPPTDARRVLVEQAVAHAWRLGRCLLAERVRRLERGRAEARGPRRRGRGRGPARPSPSWTCDPAAALASPGPAAPGPRRCSDLWRDLAERRRRAGHVDDTERAPPHPAPPDGPRPGRGRPRVARRRPRTPRGGWSSGTRCGGRQPVPAAGRPGGRGRGRGPGRSSRRSWPAGRRDGAAPAPPSSRPAGPRPRPRPSSPWRRPRRPWTTRTRAGRCCATRASTAASSAPRSTSSSSSPRPAPTSSRGRGARGRRAAPQVEEPGAVSQTQAVEQYNSCVGTATARAA